jgi:cystathionine beta-lyase
MVHPDHMDVAADPLSLLRTRTSMKWRSYPDDVLPMFVAEMDFPLAEPIAEALVAAVRRSDTGYVAPVNPLGEAFAAFAGRRWGGRSTGRSRAPQMSAWRSSRRSAGPSPGDGRDQPPIYPPFFRLCPGPAPARWVPLLRPDRLDPRPRGLQVAFAARAQAYLLCNRRSRPGIRRASDLAAVASSPPAAT